MEGPRRAEDRTGEVVRSPPRRGRRTDERRRAGREGGKRRKRPVPRPRVWRGRRHRERRGRTPRAEGARAGHRPVSRGIVRSIGDQSGQARQLGPHGLAPWPGLLAEIVGRATGQRPLRPDGPRRQERDQRPDPGPGQEASSHRPHPTPRTGPEEEISNERTVEPPRVARRKNLPQARSVIKDRPPWIHAGRVVGRRSSA